MSFLFDENVPTEGYGIVVRGSGNHLQAIMLDVNAVHQRMAENGVFTLNLYKYFGIVIGGTDMKSGSHL